MLQTPCTNRQKQTILHLTINMLSRFNTPLKKKMTVFFKRKTNKIVVRQYNYYYYFNK